MNIRKARVVLSYLAPAEHRTSVAFVTRESGCMLEETQMPVFAPSPNGTQLRQARVESGVSLRTLARTLGISAAELSAVERGEALIDQWEIAQAAIEECSR